MDARQIQEVKEELDRIYEQKAAEVNSRPPSTVLENEGGERESIDKEFDNIEDVIGVWKDFTNCFLNGQNLTIKNDKTWTSDSAKGRVIKNGNMITLQPENSINNHFVSMVSKNLLVLEDSEDTQFTLNRVVSNTKFQTLIRQINSAIWPEVSEGSSEKKATVELEEYK